VSKKKITEAKTTCDGLHRLIRKLNVAAVDLDKSGGSAYELIALLASAHACVSSLNTQLDDLADEVESGTDTNTVTQLRQIVECKTAQDMQEVADELIKKQISAQG